MKAQKSKNLKITIALLATIMLSMNFAFAIEKEEDSKNLISNNLANGNVTVSYASILDEAKTETGQTGSYDLAHFEFSKNMKLNGKHLNEGEYEVRLIDYHAGLALNFHSLSDKSSDDIQVMLDKSTGTNSELFSYTMIPIDYNKLLGEINWKGSHYSFSMEIALSNIIFSYLEREELENDADWLDYYQAAIYSYKYQIDLEDSYKWAKKALKLNENEYTMSLNKMYLEILNDNAQQLSSLQNE